MIATTGTIGELSERFGAGYLQAQTTKDNVPTVWVGAERFREVLTWLKSREGGAYSMPHRNPFREATGDTEDGTPF